MPRRERQGPGVTSELTETEVAFLWDEELPKQDMTEKWGAFFLQSWRPSFPRFNAENRTPRDLWEVFGDAVLAEWIEQRPGSRPSAWWRFVATAISREPWMPIEDSGYAGHAPSPDVQRDYLARHGLLTDRERDALALLEATR
jgi:hypothetical protein